jgi:DNA processing protein
MDDAVFVGAERFRSIRLPRPFEAAATGLWCVGDLSGLERSCVALVGTRAATPFGKQIAREMAGQLGAAGCCILSGLALGIDAAAHEGALDAGAPTVGVLGGGHRRFFPRRNRGLAERMLAAGGAVLSPYCPEVMAQPWQFLARNGVVAALADAVVVVEAPARSGALNTAGWAAGRIPVLAVPGDVDRRHVQGCLALIRDGAILARGAADVLEALGRDATLPLKPLGAQAADPSSAALIGALADGAMPIDDLIAATGVDPAAALAALSMLELEGSVECRAASVYALRQPYQRA